MTEIEALKKQRADAEVLIARRDQAMRLANNPDFKSLVLKEFCVDECARYAQLSGDPARTPTERADSLAIAQSAGHLRRWLQVIGQMGAHAESQISSIDENIDELRREGGDE